MTRERKLALGALDEFEAACAAARQTLRHDEMAVRRIRRQLERNEPLKAVIEKNRVAALRADLNQALAQLEEARHDMRLACFRLGLRENLSIGELGRLWGFSRQLASRFAREAANGDGRRPARHPRRATEPA